ncbi:TetR/AcrR family transcriptional regulator [Kitasatospora camelliae]|uniref:TetR/AcrR family transcriptional regulator n=1 Tax=Kitasatospora camelliae TaxID=3156397 RepID=A0AAU8K699_9ACTN
MPDVAAKPPRLRADAHRNRERIITAARELFVVFGAEVPLDEIAKRAGVGNATLYRHFADRRELIRQVSLSVMDRVIGHAIAAAEEEPDAFAALSRFTHAAADERIGALCPLLSEHIDADDPELEAAKVRLEQATTDLVSRAHTSGQLRPDVGVGDFVVAITQLTRPLPGAACVAVDEFTHRHLQILLDGLRAPAPSVLPGRSATLADLRRPA